MANFFIIRNKEKNMYYWGDGSWTKSKDCAKKYQHKDCAEILMQIDKLDYKICEVIEIPSIADLEAKLTESDAEIERFKEINAVQKNKIINLDKMYKQSQEVQKQLKQQLAEKDGELHQIYSHLGVEAFGEDIHEQALKEIANRENQYNQIIFKSKYTNEEMIDFAVEQLEDVKDEVEYGIKIWTSIDNYGDKVVDYSDLLEFIDQQIKLLKGNANED